MKLKGKAGAYTLWYYYHSGLKNIDLTNRGGLNCRGNLRRFRTLSLSLIYES